MMSDIEEASLDLNEEVRDLRSKTSQVVKAVLMMTKMLISISCLKTHVIRHRMNLSMLAQKLMPQVMIKWKLLLRNEYKMN